MSDEDQKPDASGRSASVPSSTPGPRESLERAQAPTSNGFRPPARPPALERAAQEAPPEIQPDDVISAEPSLDPTDDLLDTFEAAKERKAQRNPPVSQADPPQAEVPGIQIDTDERRRPDSRRLALLGGGALLGAVVTWGIVALFAGVFTPSPDTQPGVPSGQDENRPRKTVSRQSEKAPSHASPPTPSSSEGKRRLPPPVRREQNTAPPTRTAPARTRSTSERDERRLSDRERRVMPADSREELDRREENRYDAPEFVPPDERPDDDESAISRMRDGTGLNPPEEIEAQPYDPGPADDYDRDYVEPDAPIPPDPYVEENEYDPSYDGGIEPPQDYDAPPQDEVPYDDYYD